MIDALGPWGLAPSGARRSTRASDSGVIIGAGQKVALSIAAGAVTHG
jgi:hypothetical protein